MAQVAIKDVLTSELLLICRDCPLPVLVQAYVRAARQLCDHSRWLVRNVPLLTASATPVYALDLTPDTDHEVIGIRAISLDATGLGSTFEALTESFSGGWDPNDGAGVPEFYQYLPGGSVALSKTPDGVFSLLVTVVLQPTRAAQTLDETLVAAWDYALQAGALAWLLDLPRTTWMDKNEANKQFLIFRGLMNQAAASAQRGYNAGAATTDRPGRPSGAVSTRVLPI